MIKLKHKRTGGDMWVHESRLEEYLAAGHELAATPKPAHPLIADPEPEAEKPKKKTTRKKG